MCIYIYIIQTRNFKIHRIQIHAFQIRIRVSKRNLLVFTNQYLSIAKVTQNNMVVTKKKHEREIYREREREVKV